MRKIPLIATIVALTLAGCSTLTGSESVSTAENDDPTPVFSLQGSDQTLGALQDASIPDDSCGMILWTLEAQRPSAVFRFVVGETGEIMIGQRHVVLNLQAFDGASGFGVFENQKFSNDEGVVVEISSRFGLGFDGGAYIERGLIKVRDATGWSIVAPAAGIAGCRT